MLKPIIQKHYLLFPSILDREEGTAEAKHVLGAETVYRKNVRILTGYFTIGLQLCVLPLMFYSSRCQPVPDCEWMIFSSEFILLSTVTQVFILYQTLLSVN